MDTCFYHAPTPAPLWKLTPMTTPAYAIKIWSYDHAPEKYRKLFEEPKTDRKHFKIFVVWERRLAPKGTTEWVAPGAVWWNLWHFVEVCKLDTKTTVYLLTEKTQSA
jgi:hypothetical protein